jgi:hypothetical protein
MGGQIDQNLKTYIEAQKKEEELKNQSKRKSKILMEIMESEKDKIP